MTGDSVNSESGEGQIVAAVAAANAEEAAAKAEMEKTFAVHEQVSRSEHATQNAGTSGKTAKTSNPSSGFKDKDDTYKGLAINVGTEIATGGAASAAIAVAEVVSSLKNPDPSGAENSMENIGGGKKGKGKIDGPHSFNLASRRGALSSYTGDPGKTGTVKGINSISLAMHSQVQEKAATFGLKAQKAQQARLAHTNVLAAKGNAPGGVAALNRSQRMPAPPTEDMLSDGGHETA